MDNRRNFFDLLDLDPSINENLIIEEKINAFEKKYKDLVTKLGKPEHKALVALIGKKDGSEEGTMRYVMLNAARRKAEADAYILSTKFDLSKVDVLRNSLPDNFKQLEDALVHLGYNDIYDFLSHNATSGNLTGRYGFSDSSDELTGRAKELMEAYRNLSDSADKMQLASMVADFFKQGNKDVYDKFLLLSLKSEICNKVDGIIDVNGEITPDQISKRSSDYKRVYFTQKDVQAFINEYCVFKNYKLSRPEPKPVPTPIPTPTPPPTPIRQNQRNSYTPPPIDNRQNDYYDSGPDRELNLRKKLSNTTAGVLGIFFGHLGFHNFYIGRKTRGLCQLLLTGLTVVSFGQLFFFALIACIWGFSEGILLLSGKVIDIHAEDRKFNKLGAWAKKHKIIATGGTLGVMAISCITSLSMLGYIDIPADAVPTFPGNVISAPDNGSDSDWDNDSSGDLSDEGLLTTTSETNAITVVTAPPVPYLTDLAPAYQSEGNYTEYSAKNDEKNSFVMGGIIFTDGMTMKRHYDYEYTRAVYNLASQYTNLQFVLCHVDGTNNNNGTMQVFYDGILSEEYALTCYMTPEIISLDVTGVTQLEIACKIDGNDALYGFGNPTLSTEENYNAISLPIPKAQDGYVTDVLPAYQHGGNYSEYSLKDSGGTASFSMGGVRYTDGMTMKRHYDYDYTWAIYNLASQYTNLQFVLCHVDGTNNNNGTMQIFYDGILSEEYALTCYMTPEIISLDVTGVTQLEIACKIDGNDALYGFGNPTLSTKENYKTISLPIPKAQDGYATDVLPAYQHGGNYSEYSLKDSGGTASFSMGGVRYTDGMTMKRHYDYDYTWSIYNLASQYTNLQFVLCHVDGTNNNNGTMQVFYDGILSEEYALTCYMTPEIISLDVTGVTQLEIACKIDGNDALYGFGNPTLSTKENYKTISLPIPKAQDGYITDVLPAYQHGGNYSEYSLKDSGGTEYFSMGGVRYTDGMTMKRHYDYDYTWAIYNLASQYRSFKFTLGHVDDTNNNRATIVIVCDGVVVAEYSLTNDMSPKEVTLDVSNVNQLEISCKIDGNDSLYGFGNPTLTQ